MKKWKQMPEEEKRKLIALAREGDVEARNRLVEADLPFIKNVTRKIVRNKDNWEEFLSDAVEGYMRAIRTFDLGRTIVFVTYAHRNIEWRVRRAEYDFRLIRLPAYVTPQYRAKAEAVDRVSMTGEFWGTHFADRSARDRSMEDAENIAVIRDRLSAMKKRDREIVLDRISGCTLKDVGDRNKVSKEWVRQLTDRWIKETREVLCPA